MEDQVDGKHIAILMVSYFHKCINMDLLMLVRHLPDNQGNVLQLLNYYTKKKLIIYMQQINKLKFCEHLHKIWLNTYRTARNIASALSV